MIARAAEVPVVSRSLLIAVGRALRAVHVEDDDFRPLAIMNPVDPNPREIAQCRQVFLRRQPLRLEAPQLTRERGMERKSSVILRPINIKKELSLIGRTISNNNFND